MLTLAIGDLFIPERAIDIPKKFKKLLAPNSQTVPTNSKINRVVCLGNILNSTSTLQFLNNISPRFELVKGEYDDASIVSQQLQLIADSQSKSSPRRSGNSAMKVPMYSRFVHDNLKIGFTSGYQIVPRGDPLALSAFARELDVDVLIWGGTHRVEAYTLDGKFFVNPGSATGAFSFDWPEIEEDDEDEKEKADEETEDAQREQNKETATMDEANENEGPTNQEQKDTKEPEENTNLQENKDKGDNESEAFKKTLYEVTELNTNIPSFCILDTKGSTCILYIYTYFNNEVKVDKVTYNKE